ncbi:MAG: EF-P beta-lysylation protein EpmB [Gammaproteobacteria bacterium]|nr:EF-P beta-lysylation protein EpmB [Gammaproteobacteria bacterium]
MPKSTLFNLDSHTPDWQKQLSDAITDPLELLKLLRLSPEDFPACEQASKPFALKLPRSYINKIEPGNPDDPLLKQVMASAAELEISPTYTQDPVGDMKAMPVPGLLHKYQGRVLLITTGACAIHCRYCFRRHFPYSENHSSKQQWKDTLGYIQQHSDINEVILSGGDPLVLSNNKLEQLIEGLSAIPHVNTLRIHSRIPVILPARITDSLASILTKSRLKTVVVIHANHPAEITELEQHALQNLHQAGILLLNQSVLLKGVNDCSVILSGLSHKLFACNTLPYYLHILDKVQGAQHFEVPRQKAIQLMKELRHKLPGYLVPELVEEKAAEKSKLPVYGL